VPGVTLHRDSDENRNSRVAIDEQSHEIIHLMFYLKNVYYV